MKKVFISTLFVLFCASSTLCQAQSWGNLFKSKTVKDVVSSVVSNYSKFTYSDVAGAWSYKEAACKFESENLLNQAGGAIAAEKLNDKLNTMYNKVGAEKIELGFTFNEDKIFTTTAMGRNLSGNYTIDSETKEMELTYTVASLAKLGTIKVVGERKGDNLYLYFHADKLLDILKTISSYSQQETIQLMGELANSYDGLLLGYELTLIEE